MDGARILVPPPLGFVGNPNPKVADKTTYFEIVLLGVVHAKPPGVGGGEGGENAIGSG